MFKSILTAIFSVLIIPIAFSQSKTPENGELYIDTLVPRIDIVINPDTLVWIYENVWSNTEFHADFVFDNGNVRDTVKSVGFRLRGNTSRVSKKKSFKVSFNTYKSKKFYGVEKLNLNGEHNDPSIMRAKMMWDILRSWGIPAPRVNHVRLFINDVYYGLYLNVEHIDEEFLKDRYDNNDGNLYKCTYPADLKYLSSDPNAYKLNNGSGRVYELQTNETADDYSDLANFIDILNNKPNSDLICELGEVLNIYDYLKIAAADIFCGNWDGYIFNNNNFYLYHNIETDKLEYIPYDTDNTFGIDWFNIDWAERNIYNWEKDGTTRPLYTRMMDHPELRKQFTYYAKQLIEEELDIDAIIQDVENRKLMIAQYVANDPYYPLDYGYSYDDFLNSYTQGTGNHVKYGLYPFLIARKLSMQNQLEEGNMVPLIKYIKHKRELGEQIQIQAKVEAQAFPLIVKVVYNENGGELKDALMSTDGDGIYSATLTNIALETEVQYQIQVMDNNGQVQTLPCQAYTVIAIIGDRPLLFVNEIMASNTSTLADEYGNFSDWVEIYNGDDKDVFLGDFYLTDNLNWPDKWKLPNVTLAAGDFELIWTDGDPNLGTHHADFKLDKGGESIGIFNSNLNPVDSLSFDNQLTDISFGRETDASPQWITFTTPTPKASNSSIALDIGELPNEKQIYVYPNPAHGGRIYLSQEINAWVYNSSGVCVYKGNNIKSIDISKYTLGLYIIISEEGFKTRFIVY